VCERFLRNPPGVAQQHNVFFIVRLPAHPDVPALFLVAIVMWYLMPKTGRA